MARLYDSRKRILVTGGPGFLGSHLIDRLLGQGHEVIRVDRSPAKIGMLKRGEVPIYEPGLDALMEKNVDAGRLSLGPMRSSSPSERRRCPAMGMQTSPSSWPPWRMSPVP